MTLAISARAFWLTYRSLRYRDTVLTATPARSATVAMFGFRFILGSVILPDACGVRSGRLPRLDREDARRREGARDGGELGRDASKGKRRGGDLYDVRAPSSR